MQKGDGGGEGAVMCVGVRECGCECTLEVSGMGGQPRILLTLTGSSACSRQAKGPQIGQRVRWDWGVGSSSSGGGRDAISLSPWALWPLEPL